MHKPGSETTAVRNWPSGHAHRPLSPPIHLASVWEAGDSPGLARLFDRHPDEGFYTRFGHPTLRLAERKIAALEGAEDALVFGSGMAAIACSVVSVLEAGDHVVAHRSIFGQTMQLFELLRDRFGVDVSFADTREPGVVGERLRETTRLVYIETPSNPNIDIVDIARVVREAAPVPVFVDSTFAGPILQNPLDHGATLTLHSASKSMGGHADLLAGAAVGGTATLARVRDMRTLFGPVLDPQACWRLLRGLQTLPLRVEAQSRRAQAIVRLLTAHPLVERVLYPFLPGSPWEEVARRQMREGGGMLSFTLRGGRDAAGRFVESLRLIACASSLGHVYTTVEIPGDLDFSPRELGHLATGSGVPEGLLRLSVGIEGLEDLLEDVGQALDAVGGTPAVP